ncbi:hypothetical protein DACRYDRAFT_19548 [Dacryopinax primogenitus]|uniref:Btz domain-containing protein n=1 Tax=Dacryopinax primogenitus (strain DJM 731) TaxID=1858805 RepID=M5GFJ4_DACPD|nr:uncharacterized protein DACRYDRAFT_19548 [Dacryopinax primogenitus]EJU06362.1 hypothetical protein DACRYDRAFT_19548 [Dacryopinax primogenitus]
MIMATTSASPVDVMPKLAQQTASVPDLQQTQPDASSATLAQRTRKARSVRHARRRRRGEEEDSEDEIVRDAGSESESEREELVDSEEESDVDDVEEPPTLVPSVNGKATISTTVEVAPSESTIPTATKWSDMVTSELDGGADASLPIIDFAEMGSVTPSASAAPVTTAPVPNEVESVSVKASASTSSGKTSSKTGPSARQAYLQRLENDPQFIPRVGAFWGHDDRLLDKGLRSMSPWWRDRQMAFRARGGMGRGGSEGGSRGRGRGRAGAAYYGGRGEAEASHTPVHAPATGPVPDTEAVPSALEASLAVPVPAPVPPPPPPAHPSDLPWGHDGYEELKRTDAERAARGRGRGGFRGRGAVRGAPPARGGHAVHGAPRAAVVSTTNAPSSFKNTRAEKPWTKDLAVHLYTDPTLQPKDNQGAGIRLKFPGSPNEGVVVRLPATISEPDRTRSPASASSAMKGPKVKLPSVPNPRSLSGTISVVDNGDFAQTVGSGPLSTPPSGNLVLETTAVPVPSATTEPVPVPEIDTVTKLEKQFQNIAVQQQQVAPQPQFKAINGFDPTALTNDKSLDIRPTPTQHQTLPPPHLQISPQPYPQYSYGVALPPGIAMDENGVCFEVATGRVVILQQPTPSPIYHPRPTAPLPGFVPHLRPMQNPSPETFTPSPFSDAVQPALPDAYLYPDQSGMPYFAQRRSSGPISIRSPTEPPSTAKPASSAGPPSSSLLRAAVHAAPFQPNRSLVTPQPSSFVPRAGYFTGSYDVSPVPLTGPSALPDDPAIVGRDLTLTQYATYYPPEQMYAYPPGEYAYTTYGYEGAVPEGYVPPADGRGPAVYY